MLSLVYLCISSNTHFFSILSKGEKSHNTDKQGKLFPFYETFIFGLNDVRLQSVKCLETFLKIVLLIVFSIVFNDSVFILVKTVLFNMKVKV